MKEAVSNFELEFDLNELEADLLAFDLDELNENLLKFDLDEAEENALMCGPNEPEEDLEFIELNDLKRFICEPKSFHQPVWRRMAAAACGCLALSGAIYTVYLTMDSLAQEYASEQKVAELRTVQQDHAKDDTAQGEMEPVAFEQETLTENPYADAFSQNGDMTAWLIVEGTVVDYPVMQTIGDEEYYLYRDFYGNEDKSGSLILDTDSSLYDDSLTTNLIIHGHNMKIGTMFGRLDEYKDEGYYQEHKYMELYTEEELRRYEVIAVFYSQVYYTTDQTFKYYNFFHADTEDEFRYFYDNIKELSIYDTGVTAELGDNFLTLSTCAYHVEDGRFVIVAKEIDRKRKYVV